MSGWGDLNSRLLRPERSALPDCATSRFESKNGKGGIFFNHFFVKYYMIYFIRSIPAGHEVKDWKEEGCDGSGQSHRIVSGGTVKITCHISNGLA